MEKTAVYRNDADLIHVLDGKRGEMGEWVAQQLDGEMRDAAYQRGQRTFDQTFGTERQKLCPGCYMPVMFNALLELARQNGQDVRELGRSMVGMFQKLADDGDPTPLEDVRVIRDAVPPVVQDDDNPYLDNFDPNVEYEAPRQFGYTLPETERDFVMGIASYGLDAGLLR